VSPAFWDAKAGYDDQISATCGAYAQVGLTLNRKGRARFYGEVRITQLLLAVTHPVTDGTLYASTTSDPYRPMFVSFQGGVGW
jgi:hypothetical protein